LMELLVKEAEHYDAQCPLLFKHGGPLFGILEFAGIGDPRQPTRYFAFMPIWRVCVCGACLLRATGTYHKSRYSHPAWSALFPFSRQGLAFQSRVSGGTIAP
jgi:hypothetical protein